MLQVPDDATEGRKQSEAQPFLSLLALDRVLPVAAFVLALLFIASSLLAYALFHFRILVGDDWGLYDRFLNHPFWISIWSSWNGHRLFIPGLLDKINLLLFHGDLTNLVIIGIVAQIASAWMLARDASLELVHRGARWLLIALVLALMLWLGNRRALVWSFGLTYTLGVFGAVAACHCVFRSRQAEAKPGLSWLWLFAAMASAVITSLSWGSGVVVWPILVLLAWGLGLSRTGWITLLVSGTAFISVYLVHLLRGSGAEFMFADPGAVPDDLNRMLLVLGNTPGFLLASLVNNVPIHPSRLWNASSTVVWCARATGLFSLLALAGLVGLWLRQSLRRRWLLPLIGIGLFVVGTALIIGVVRGLFEGSTTIISRYRVFSTLLWTALVAGYSPLILRNMASVCRYQVLAAEVIVIMLVFLPGQAQEFVRAGEREYQVERATLSLVTGVTDMSAMWNVFSFDKSQITDVAPYLSRNQLTVFRQLWTHWMNTRLRHVAGSDKTIVGGLTEVWHFPNDDWSTIKGWLSTAHRGALIVGVDASGRIRGMALPILSLQEVAGSKVFPRRFWLASLFQAMNDKLPVILGWGRGWTGYVVEPYDPRQLRYFLVKQDKTVIAQLKQ